MPVAFAERRLLTTVLFSGQIPAFEGEQRFRKGARGFSDLRNLAGFQRVPLAMMAANKVALFLLR
jgi:hypothetical protein